MSGILVGLLTFLLRRVIYYLPSPVLSSIIIMSVSKLIDVKGAKELWRQDKSDLAVSCHTCVHAALPLWRPDCIRVHLLFSGARACVRAAGDGVFVLCHAGVWRANWREHRDDVLAGHLHLALHTACHHGAWPHPRYAAAFDLLKLSVEC